MSAGPSRPDPGARRPGAPNPASFEDPDRDLLPALRRGERDALARVYERYAARMRRLARAVTGSATDAEDVVQEVFLGLPEAARRFEERCPLWGWLRRVTLLAARNELREEGRRREVPLWTEAHADDPQLDPTDRIALERAVERLPPTYRTIVLLREVEGLPHAEIAEALGISTQASCMRMSRARALLRERLRR